MDFLYYIVACLATLFICAPLFSIATSLEKIANKETVND